MMQLAEVFIVVWDVPQHVLHRLPHQCFAMARGSCRSYSMQRIHIIVPYCQWLSARHCNGYSVANASRNIILLHNEIDKHSKGEWRTRQHLHSILLLETVNECQQTYSQSKLKEQVIGTHMIDECDDELARNNAIYIYTSTHACYCHLS
jgi:hypothetical protein